MTEKEAFDLFTEKGFTYNPETGEIKTHMGKDITPTNYRNKMYIRCSIKYNSQTINVGGHRLAWYMTYGEIPNIIDHIDGDSLNNRITNLRNVDQTKNCWNRKNNNYSKPIKGYYWRKNRNKWKAGIVVSGKRITLGHFDTEEEAHQAYLDAKKIYHII